MIGKVKARLGLQKIAEVDRAAEYAARLAQVMHAKVEAAGLSDDAATRLTHIVDLLEEVRAEAATVDAIRKQLAEEDS